VSGPDDEVRLAPARPEDAAAMRALARSSYARYVERIGREPAPMTADYESIASSGRALLARRGAALIGMLVTSLEDSALLVENLAVLPEAQGGGVGSLLLREAEDFAQKGGRTQIRLFTNEAMVENLDYYRRRGFVETHRAPQAGFRRVFLTKTLPRPAG
jgi:ribosomal protein S18 acetylase RimI-like enzyme